MAQDDETPPPPPEEPSGKALTAKRKAQRQSREAAEILWNLILLNIHQAKS